MRQIVTRSPVSETTHCGRCGTPLNSHSLGEVCKETFRFDFTGGYGSCFGDGTHIHGSFCQDCIEQVFQPFLRRCVDLHKGASDDVPRVLVCDRCGRQMPKDVERFEWQEALTVRYPRHQGGGPQPPQVMETDICQHCMLHTFGAYLRITEDFAMKPKRRSAPRPQWVYQQPELEEGWARDSSPHQWDAGP